MRVIAFTNEKGGVGKTTGARHIGAGLAQRDKRVLLIDADAQAHCGHQLGIDDRGGLYRLLVQGAAWDDVLVTPEAKHWAIPGGFPLVGTLALLPSNHETALIPLAISNPLVLRERLAEVVDRFDVVLVDTSPSPSLLHSVIYMAADGVIYPTTCNQLSLRGLQQSMEHIRAADGSRRGYGLSRVRLLGVLPMMYQHTTAHMFGRELLETNFGERVWESIPQRTIWRDCEFAKQTLYAFAPGDIATQEIDGIVDRVAAYV